jgi:hypothetical protein
MAFRGKCLSLAPVDPNCAISIYYGNGLSRCQLCDQDYTLVGEAWVVDSSGNYKKQKSNFCLRNRFEIADAVLTILELIFTPPVMLKYVEMAKGQMMMRLFV